MFARSWLRLGLHLLLLAVARVGVVASNAQCSMNRLTADGDIILSTQLGVHKPSTERIYGCSNINIRSLETVQAIKWILGILNQNSGSVFGQPVQHSFIPGVKIGMEFFDSCGHSSLATKQLTDFFPEITTGNKQCLTLNQSQLAHAGIIDMTSMFEEPGVANTIQNFFIPRIPVDNSGSLSATSLASNLVAVIKELQWKNVVLVNVDDEYSIRVVKAVGQLTARSNICISSVHVVPSTSDIEKPQDQDLKLHRSIIKTISSAKDNLGVIFIGHGRSAQHFLKVLAEAESVAKMNQWFFSSVINPRYIDSMPQVIQLINSNRLYSLTPYPAIMTNFEEYWKQILKSDSLQETEKLWMEEYQQLQEACASDASKNECSDFILTYSTLESIIRTDNIIPSIHAILTYAHALKAAWKSACKDVPGFCPQMARMSRKDFLQNYLLPLTFVHSPKNRSPENLNGRKAVHTLPNQISDTKTALTLFQYDKNDGFSFSQVVLVEEGKILNVDPQLKMTPSVCSRQECKKCISVRQSRLMSASNDLDGWTYPAKYDVLIPILLPLHEPGANVMECGTKLNPLAVQSLEALIWTLDDINNNTEMAAGVTVGTMVLDTCSSTLKTAERISELYKDRPIDVESILAFVTTTSEEHETAVSMLAPMNVTTVSIAQVDTLLGEQHYNYQVPVPISVTAQAVVSLLAQRQWKFVTLVSSHSKNALDGAEYFRQIAKDHNVCLANDFILPEKIIEGEEGFKAFDDLVLRLKEAKDRGSMFIVLWTSVEDTRKLLAATQRATNAGLISRNEFNWIGTKTWGDNLNIVRGFEDVTTGAIVVSPPYNDDLKFISHYVRLNFQNGLKNPWLEQYWGQVFQSCSEGDQIDECQVQPGDNFPRLKYRKTSNVPNVIQAVRSIVSAFKKLSVVVCKNKAGLCSDLYHRPDLKYLLNQYIQYVPAPSADNDFPTFHFTDQGYGNSPILLWNFNIVTGEPKYKRMQFSKQTEMVIYERAAVVSVGQVTSECHIDCKSCTNRPRHIFIPSKDGLYLAAIFPIHDQDKRSLECGQISTAYGIQNMEAFLWAVDIINRSQKLLPWIDIGVIGLDTCSSKEKTVRDVYNLFTSSQELGFNVQPYQIAGVVSGSTAAEVKAVVSITEELGVTTITPDAASLEENSAKNLVRLALPNRQRASVIVNILRTFRWTYASVVYLSGDTVENDIFQHLLEKAKDSGLTFALQQGISEDLSKPEDMFELLKLLFDKKKEGSNAIVLILPPQLVHLLFRAILKLPKEHQVMPGDFAWVIMDEDATIGDLPLFALGSVIVRPNFSHIPKFTHYFQNLKLENNTRNSWFREYMQGPGKFTHRHLLHGESVVNTINGVYALAQALDKVRKDLCPEISAGLCNSMKTSHPALKADIHKYILGTTFRGSDMRPISISPDGQGSGQFQILNYQQTSHNQASFVVVGEYSKDSELVLNASSVLGYDRSLHAHRLTEFVSKCQVKNCYGIQGMPQTSKLSMPADFVIGALLAIHQHDSNFFKCGKINNDRIFQNLIALTFAIDKINGNSSLLPNMNIGMMLVDYCGRPERAQKELFTYFDRRQTDEASSNLIGAITFDPPVATAVSPILDANDILQVINPISAMDQSGKKFQTMHQLVPKSHGAILTAVNLVHTYQWRYVNVIYSATPRGKQKRDVFLNGANKKGICIAKSFESDENMLQQSVDSLISHLVKNGDSQVIVLMVDNTREAKMILDQVDRAGLSSKFMWILVGKWANENNLKSLGSIVQGSFIINMDSYNIPQFQEYYTSLTLESHRPIPDDWFEEFWQSVFACRLPHSKVAADESIAECTGSESLKSIPFEQDEHVFHTIDVVQVIAETLHSFLADRCKWNKEYKTINDCEGVGSKDLRQALLDAITMDNRTSNQGYVIFNSQLVKTGRYHFKTVGRSIKNKFSLNKNEVKLMVNVDSKCNGECDMCYEQLNKGHQTLVKEQSMDEKFSTVWGLVTTSISLLGILLVIICILYFLMAFPISTGTTVLGYLILVGVLLLYGSNLSFIVGPSVNTCGVRRVLMGVAYAIIFSGMLIKAFNTWRLSGCNDSDVKYRTRMTKPAGLLSIASGLVLIQAVLVTAWMVLMPSQVVLVKDAWFCAPILRFEQQLFISLTYCGLLLLLTLLFSGLSWNCQENHRESRWIFICCLLIGISWTVSMVLSTNLPQYMRDPAIIISNIVCASVVMLLLYLRKVYLYSKFSKQVKDFELTTHLKSRQYGSSAYGTCLRPNGIHTVPEFIRGSQVSVSSDFTFEGAPNSTMTELTSEGMSTRSSASSAQVQGTDLYPMEVYDGGSQFQAHNLSCNSRRALVIDDLKMGDH